MENRGYITVNNNCIGCGRCISHCPQRINIPEEMEKMDRFVEQLKQSDAQ
jgi:predicted aldo/keto reductase-like oxidoreductase